jgi:hypothetical protein
MKEAFLPVRGGRRPLETRISVLDRESTTLYPVDMEKTRDQSNRQVFDARSRSCVGVW